MNKLEEFLQEIKKQKKSEKISTKQVISYYGVAKRGWRVIENVNSWLEKYELEMKPPLDRTNFYGSVEISLKPTIQSNGELKKAKYVDVIPRLNIIKSSDLNCPDNIYGLVSVRKETSITEAITLMIKHNYSQLPILSGSKEAFGLVSWKSIGMALALGKKCEFVKDCYESVEVLNYDEPLFKAVKIILDKEVVLVKDSKKDISGIVTATDIGEQFLILSEPFLLIEQIENLIRQILDDKLTLDDINTVLDLEKYNKEIRHLSDLTFGHYVRIIENENLFKKLEIKIDRVILQKMLTDVNITRNEVMHFNPEEMEENKLLKLRQTLDFLQAIVEHK
ncbi:CBS domain-containing protein (plasmid) [Chryseobacterium panacisoli]|uniref:CBS domain-containing protein n=1 Tax=Chryseobacterium panacisoli TaxID=1807141 RepID=A0A5D8ZXT9_9FLAO|nr:CBS domain-containing protein [Chryseobacterium panacisoli]TZF99073.1 CBS domain-containing protein [Chryseobacterium panacisoli]